MKRSLQQIALLVAKDLRIEARGKQTVGLVIVLGVLIIVVLGMGLGTGGPGAPMSGFKSTAILWVAYLFGGVLCFEKTMAVERQDDALAGLLVAPLDRGALYIAKLLSNLTLMFVLALVVTPVAILLFRFDLSTHPWGFVIVMALGMTGFAAIGTLFAAAVSSTRLQGGLLALLVFPLSLPVVHASTQMMRKMFEEGEALSGGGLATLLAFDLMFLALSWFVFELVLEP
ncbi:MAG: heme exporter protein CcmB [Phycisphaerales bacterium]|nr:MAG: heme exporter protein CcmB [Phycisphaerales bacterium]